MTVAAMVLIALSALSISLYLWQLWVGFRFPIKRISDDHSFHPPVSVLKPLKGRDAETERCLESWFRQKYVGDWELWFAVHSADDPVCEIVQRLKARYPSVKAELVVAAPSLGPNGKVSSLCYLSRHARHGNVVISDADIFADEHLLAGIAAEMREEHVGLVNYFYILANPTNLAMRLEAVAVNADFWTQVLQALTLRKMDFALGAVIGIRRSLLDRIGGFEPFLDVLADDYHLGKRIFQLGVDLKICGFPVECRTQEQHEADVWRHQLRWARTVRVCRPWGHFLSILANPTFWPTVALISKTSASGWLFVTGLALRMLGAVWSYQKLTGRWELWVAPLAPIKDLLQVGLWLVALLGNAVTWSGERFRVSRGGKLTPLA